MRAIFDFECPFGHINEEFVDAAVHQTACRDCGAPAERRISPPRVRLEGITGAFPTAADAWVRRREEKMRQEARRGDA